MKNAKLIKADGTETEIQPINGKNFSLTECYQHLNCDLIEVVYLNDKEILIVDEEGLLKSNCAVNVKASTIAVRAKASDGIVGDAIHCPSSMLE
jgi:hypothetical protein